MAYLSSINPEHWVFSPGRPLFMSFQILSHSSSCVVWTLTAALKQTAICCNACCQWKHLDSLFSVYFHQAPITSSCREGMLAMQPVWNSVPSRSWRTYGPINLVWTSSTMLPWWVVRHCKSPNRLFLPLVCLPSSCDVSSQNYEFISKSRFLILCDKCHLSLHVSSYIVVMWSIRLAALML